MKKQLLFFWILALGLVYDTTGQYQINATGANDMRLRTNGADRLNITTGGNVGIGAGTTPSTKLNVNGDLALSKITRFTTNGGYTATNRAGASILIFEAGGTLNGIAAGYDGLLLYVLNGQPVTAVTTGDLIIKNNEAVSELTPANRILTHTGGDFTLPTGYGGVLMMYDAGISRWRVIETIASGSSVVGWALAGNSGTNPATSFMGTTDTQPLVFRTYNLERMRILGSGGNVGIGTTTPDTKLHVQSGSAGTVTPRSGTLGTLEGSSSSYLSILTPNTSTGGVSFGSPDGNADGSVNYSHSSQKMQFNTKATTRVTIDSAGFVGINDTSPSYQLDVNGSVRSQRDLTLKETLLQPTISDIYDPFDRKDRSFVTIEPPSNVTTTIKGFTPPANGTGTYGTVLYISNGSTGSIVLKHNDATVTNYRIITNTGNDVTISGRGGAILIYDYTGWRLIAYAP